VILEYDQKVNLTTGEKLELIMKCEKCEKEDENKMTDKEKIGLRVAQLSLKEIPSGDYRRLNFCEYIWEAFNYGRIYEELDRESK